MKQVSLKCSVRDNVGRKSSRDIRNQGMFPAVMYGESGVRHLAFDAHSFNMAYREIVGRAALIELDIEGDSDEEKQYAIIQELDRHPLSDKVVHLDLKEIVRGKEMEADIPVTALGNAAGVRNQGGVLDMSLDTLRVRCRPRHLPETIIVDVKSLMIGDSIHVRDVEAPEGVTFLDDGDIVVAACVGASAGSSADEEGSESEPEAVAASS